MTELIEKLSDELSAELIRETPLRLFSPLAEHHGSWELVFYVAPARDLESVDRFVSVAFTNTANLSDEPLYYVEVRAAVEGGNRYVRELVAQYYATNGDLADNEFRNRLKQDLGKAARFVIELRHFEMSEVAPAFRRPPAELGGSH